MIGLLVRASFEGALAILAAAVAIRFLGRRSAGLGASPGLAAILWWLACARLLAGLVVPVPIMNIPAARVLAPVSEMIEPARDAAGAIGVNSDRWSAPDRGSVAGGLAVGADAVARVVFLVWITGFIVSIVPGLIALRRAARDAAGADLQTLAAPDLELLERIRRLMGLRRAPAVRLSGRTHAPFLFGVGRTVVVLPEDRWSRMPSHEREMILAHELIHARRHDALWSAVPWLAARIFWFHPLARWAAREFAFAREAACDREVLLRLDASPRQYGELLVSLCTVSPAPALGVAASPTFRSLHRRLVMLDRPASRAHRRGAILAFAATAIVVLVPFRFSGAGSPLTADATSATTSIWNASQDNEDSIVLVEGDDVRMTGTIAAAERARDLAHERGVKELVFFSHRRKGYVMNDSAATAKVHQIVHAFDEWDRKQTELGLQQSILGERQAALGRQQAELALAMAKIEEQRAQLESERQRRQLKDEDSEEIEARLEDLSGQMEHLSAAMEELGRQQSGIGEDQERLGDRQGAIGKQQERESEKVWGQVKALIEDARKNGKVEEVKN